MRLSTASYVPLWDEAEGKRLTGDRFYCKAGRHAYLVKAVYGHSMTGGFLIGHRGSVIYTEHSSLGHSSPENITAYAVCVDFEVTGAVSSRSVAE